jgi:O-antigen ligase
MSRNTGLQNAPSTHRSLDTQGVTLSATAQHAAQGAILRVSAAQRATLLEYENVPRAVRWAFIAFAAVIPFEGASIATSLSVSKLSGVFFIVCYLFFYNPLSGKRRLPSGSAPLVWFLVYFSVLLANAPFVDSSYLRQLITISLTLAQLLVLFWISSSLLTIEILRRRVLLAFAFGAVLCAVATLLNMPGFATVIESRVGERLTSMDSNPNYVAFAMVIAAVILIGTALDATLPNLWSKAFLASLVLPLLAVAVRTGSRTGVASFLIGFGICLFSGRRSGHRLMALLLFLSVSAAMTYLVVRYPTVLSRFQEASAGNLAGRQNIIPVALEMVAERPILGWQPAVYWEELGRRTGRVFGTRDAHNLILHLMLEVGVIGAAPFLLGVVLCVRGAWSARTQVGILPFALLMTTLSSNLSLTYIARKPQWLVFALAVAAASAMTRKIIAPSAYIVRRPLPRAPAERGAAVSF